MNRIRIQDAEAIVEEERQWVCESCQTMLAPTDRRWCRFCRDYWEDVAAGVFDYDYEALSSAQKPEPGDR